MATGAPQERLLLVMRHARAERHAALADELRPLSLDGRKQCAEIARRLTDAGLWPEHVLVSSAVRTRQTWELLRAGLTDAPQPSVEVTDRAYEATPGQLLDLLQDVDDRVRAVLLVAHEPAVSALASLVAGADGTEEGLALVRRGLPTGTCVAVRTQAPWSRLGPGDGRLEEVLRPSREA